MRAVYPGSFDPITNGHLDIIRRARKVFSHLVVGVVANPRKDPLFSSEQRVRLVRQTLADQAITSVEAKVYQGLLVDFVRAEDACAVVRGLRATSDFDYEFQMALTNRDLARTVESVFFMAAGEYTFLSSSIVKEVGRLGGDVSGLVPRHVQDALATEFSSS